MSNKPSKDELLSAYRDLEGITIVAASKDVAEIREALKGDSAETPRIDGALMSRAFEIERAIEIIERAGDYL